MIIYNSGGTEILKIEVDDNSYRYRAIKGDNSLTLYYSLAEHVELPIGSYCDFQGERYSLENPESFKMKHSRLFEYTVIFESPAAKAEKWKFRNMVDGRLKFQLTAKPIEHLQMFVDNMNRRDSGWTVGSCVDGDEVLINYNHVYCHEALALMASELKTEFEYNGKTVSLRKVEYNKNNPLKLSYGRGKGFKPGVGRSNYGDKPPIEILYVQGGIDNIDPSKYGNAELLLPKNQTITYNGRSYIVDEKGLSIRRSDKSLSSLAEDSLDCSDIYPKRVGTVTAMHVVDAEKHFYDFFDSSIPEALNYMNCLIAGESMTVIFQSGMLAGREFEVKYYHTVEDKPVRRFEIVPQEMDGQTMPNDTFAPKEGDKYVVFKCMLPDAYICDNETQTGASWDMFRAAVKYLFDNEEYQFSFSGELDGIWAKKDWVNIGGKIKLGGYVLFTDDRFQQEGVLVRIIGIKDYINNPHSPEIELSNSTVSGGFSTTINQLQGEEVLVEDYHREALQFTKRRFRDAKETISLLEKSLLDFSGSINPITVQAMLLLIGDESLQFRFVDSMTNPTRVSHSITYDDATKQLTVAAGIIQHMTIGIDSLSSSHTPDKYKFWSLPLYNSAKLEDEEKKYYLYARVSKTDQTGMFLLSETAIGMEDEAEYYHLLTGVLNSEYNRVRSFVTLYGFTEILPGRITTDRIVSGDGLSYFDMLANAMKLGDALDFNSQGDGKLKIKGTIVQSQSGDETYIGCYRGVYNSSYTYYSGDEVSYTSNGNTSTYRYIYETPSKGVVPTDSNYWQIIAEGSEGKPGQDAWAPYIGSNGNWWVWNHNLKSYVDTGDSAKGDDGKSPYVGSNNNWWVWDGTKWVDTGIKAQGQDGEDGANGDFTELRFAVNGSTTVSPALDRNAVNPSGWTTTQPSIGVGQYLWLTFAKKTYDGSKLIQQWTIPVRITPYDGTDGAPGSSPVMVFRGVYNSSNTYYGNNTRLDCVKSGSDYYIARIDAGTFSGYSPTNTSKWNSFGASFESVATNLLLSEHANIGDWFMSGGRIVSTLETGDKIILDATNNIIQIISSSSGGDYSQERIGSTITLNASSGIIEARANDITAVSYMSPTGVFANRAGTQCVAASTGLDQRAAIVALGRGNLSKSDWQINNVDEKLLAGVYGVASNDGTAPAYGGYFYNIKIQGLTYGVKFISYSGTYLTDEMSYVVGLTNGQANVYLPAATRIGQTIAFKQMAPGYMRIYTRSGQKLYDNDTENSYYDLSSGDRAEVTFIVIWINNVRTEIWLISRYKF